MVESNEAIALVLEKLIDCIIIEDCFEMHWLVKSGAMDMDELLGIDPIQKDGFKDIGKKIVQGTKKISGSSSGVHLAKNGAVAKKGQGLGLNTSGFGSQVVSCPICGQLWRGADSHHIWSVVWSEGEGRVEGMSPVWRRW